MISATPRRARCLKPAPTVGGAAEDRLSSLKTLGKTLSPEEYEQRGEDVWVAKSAKLYPNVYIAGPTIIGPETEVRPAHLSAATRSSALAASSQFHRGENAILFDGAQAPHYNYIGDSVMGHKAHTGAGAVTSNLKQDHSNVTVLKDGERVETGMRKFGACWATTPKSAAAAF